MLANKLKTDKRVNPRVPIKIPIKYRIMNEGGDFKGIEDWQKSEKSAYTLDMSLEGMRLAVDQPLPEGYVIKSVIYLLDNKTKISVYAEVAWAEPRGVGIHFLLMVNEEREALRVFLENYFPVEHSRN